MRSLTCLAAILSVAFLAGCVNRADAYRSPDGHIAVCSANGAGVIPAMMASDSLDKCGDQYLKAGYTKVP